MQVRNVSEDGCLAYFLLTAAIFLHGAAAQHAAHCQLCLESMQVRRGTDTQTGECLFGAFLSFFVEIYVLCLSAYAA